MLLIPSGGLSAFRLTEVSVDQFAVVHLSSHGSDLLQLGFLSLHSLLQALQLLGFRLNKERRRKKAKHTFAFLANFYGS